MLWIFLKAAPWVKFCFYSSFVEEETEALGFRNAESASLSVVSDSVSPWTMQSIDFSRGQNTGVGSLSLPQGIFLMQGLNPGLLTCRWILYQLSPQVWLVEGGLKLKCSSPLYHSVALRINTRFGCFAA